MELGKLIDLPKVIDARGNLTVAESVKSIPFAVKRVYWVYDVPGGECRGGHAHKDCLEILIAVSGSFNVTLDDGTNKKTYLLNHPYQGLLIDKSTWRTLEDFSSGAVCLVLASEYFEETDYIRDYDKFIEYVKCSK